MTIPDFFLLWNLIFYMISNEKHTKNKNMVFWPKMFLYNMRIELKMKRNEYEIKPVFSGGAKWWRCASDINDNFHFIMSYVYIKHISSAEKNT